MLELVEGETLQQRLLRGPMPLREALRCAAGIAAALEAAHGKGIIHRDLKPSNIKITAAGAIKVLDFGVAKLARDSGSELGAPDLTLTLEGRKRACSSAPLPTSVPSRRWATALTEKRHLGVRLSLVRDVDGKARVSWRGGGGYAWRRHARRT